MSNTLFTLPLKITREEFITKIKLDIVNIQFNESVTFRVSFPENEDFIPSGYVKIDGENYQNWMNDDRYVIKVLLSKFHLNHISEESTFDSSMPWSDFVSHYTPNRLDIG